MTYKDRTVDSEGRARDLEGMRSSRAMGKKGDSDARAGQMTLRPQGAQESWEQ